MKKFESTDSGYVSTDNVVRGNFNLHIELPSAGNIIVKQKTAGSVYANVQTYNNVTVIDEDFVGFVFGKKIEVQCSVNPDFAAITSYSNV